jgi:uncharacterized membrane protein YqaE (UPF0057 family)
MCNADIFLGLLALLFPPLPVWVKCGICSVDSLINILLCMLGYVPGLLHSWYIIAKYPETPYEYTTVEDREGGTVTYIFVQDSDGRRHQQRVVNQQPKPTGPLSPNAGPNYGTAGSSSAPAPAPAAGPSAPAASSSAPENNAGEGSSHGPPPPAYNEVVGDHKVQSQS